MSENGLHILPCVRKFHSLCAKQTAKHINSSFCQFVLSLSNLEVKLQKSELDFERVRQWHVIIGEGGISGLN